MMFKKILVPLDGSQLAEQALPMAEAVGRTTGASIELLYVHEPDRSGGHPDTPWNAERRAYETAYVESRAEQTWDGTGLNVNGHFTVGTAVSAICARAGTIAADLIVMTTHGRTGFSREWLGSIADGVVRAGCAPVLLVRAASPKDTPEPSTPGFKRILVPLNGSPRSESILPPAAELAMASKGMLALVEIVAPIPLITPDATLTYGTGLMIRDPEATDAVASAAADRLKVLERRAGAMGVQRVESHVVVHDFAAQAILDAARFNEADVIAMATSSRGGSRMFVGSVTDKVMRASRVPLLLVAGRSADNPA